MGEELLLESLQEFYAKGTYGAQLLSVIQGDQRLSLRSIDWFITNYSKKHNIYYLVHETREGFPTSEQNGYKTRNFNVHQSYKSQLKAYSKKRFDPFCRRERIEFQIPTGMIETTIGQLNFFRWALANSVTDYIFEHKQTIEDDMNVCLKQIKLKSTKKHGKRKQREELSLSATRGLSRTNIKVELTFD